MKNIYQTQTRRSLLSLFSANSDRHFTAEQVCTLICGVNDSGTALVGKSTVYRQLSKLCQQGLLRRFEDVTQDGIAVHVYQYVVPDHSCEEHFHLKCQICGRVTHLECDKTDSLIAHIRKDHSFLVDCGNSILYGVCGKCSQKVNREGGKL